MTIQVNPHDEKALRAELEESRERVEGLERELLAIDSELDDLAMERQQYDLLRDVCGALEKLGELGGEDLFWGGGEIEGGGAYHVRLVRDRVDEFHRRIGAIDEGRQAILDRIAKENQCTEVIEEDLYELRLEEEQRKLEWLIEREADDLAPRDTLMPWSRGGEDDQRFRKSLGISLLASLLLGLLLPMIDLPIPDRWEVVEVPERFTRLLKEEQPPPPPPKPLEKIVEEELPEESSEEQVAEEKKAPTPGPEQKPVVAPQSKGILAFREKFAGLAASKPTDRLGAKARISRSGETASGAPSRSLVTSSAPGTSGGINVAALSREVGGGGGGGLEGVETATVTSAIGAIAGPERPLSGGPGPARTDEEIQIVFDRHKAALYRLYNRELRRDPTLKGQMVLRITIEPDGTVSLCEIKSSDMKAPTLAAQVVKRVGTFDFGAKEGVPSITILYPIDFLPAT